MTRYKATEEELRAKVEKETPDKTWLMQEAAGVSKEGTKSGSLEVNSTATAATAILEILAKTTQGQVWERKALIESIAKYNYPISSDKKVLDSNGRPKWVADADYAISSLYKKGILQRAGRGEYTFAGGTPGTPIVSPPIKADKATTPSAKSKSPNIILEPVKEAKTFHNQSEVAPEDIKAIYKDTHTTANLDWCHEVDKEGWTCTRDKGHTGFHEAGMLKNKAKAEIQARWGTPDKTTRKPGSKAEAVVEEVKPVEVVKPPVDVMARVKEREEMAKAREIAEPSEAVAEVKGEVNGDLYLKNPPPKFYSEQDLKVNLEAMVNKQSPPLNIEGNKGVGKTLAVQDFAYKYHIPLIPVQCNRDMTDMELIGHDVLKGDKTEFEPGELPRAIEVANKTGTAILLLDEINTLRPEYQKALNSLFDDRRSVFGNKRAWRLNKDANLIIIGTMNPSSYAGTYPLNEELESRFAVEYIDYPKPAEEIKMLSDYTTDKELIANMVKLAQFTRGQGAEFYALSPRETKGTVLKYNSLIDAGVSKKEALRIALKTTVINHYKLEDEKEAVKLKISDIFGADAVG